MKFNLTPITIDDICAFCIIVGCLVLIGCNRDGEVKAILGVAAGWLFGKRVQTRKD